MTQALSPAGAKPLVTVVACALARPAPIAGGAGSGAAAVLLAQRPRGKNLAGFWEFPGGKIEPNERPEEALAREFYEELGIKLREADMQPLSFASHAYENFHLLMPLYLCCRFSGQPQPREGQALQWVGAQALAADYRHYRQADLAAGAAAEPAVACPVAPPGVKFPLPPADIPLVPALLAALKGLGRE